MANNVIATPIFTSNEHGTRGRETENEQHQHVEQEEEEERQRSTIMGTEENVLTHDTSVLTQTVPTRELRITFGKFLLRSHSTGHSLVEEPEVNVDRHTLRLAEHVRKQIVCLRRNDVALPGVWSSKRTWSSMTPPFVSSGWSETTCWTPLRMSFCNTKGPQKPFHLLPL
ncbi:PREDICTED: uncharacterized protein LOC109343685 isoform X2 [Lupinus angustifolius]|nr:PREDICTED: uncharacterized protein LOC109343685 isoform X2 [Lupinus angustifolius]